MRCILFFIIGLIIILPLSSLEKVEERAGVDWWVLPIFALDKSGNSITDLKKNDVELQINNRTVSEFMLHKRAFYAGQKERKTESPHVVEKKKILFLLFDTAFSSRDNFERSKEIARHLVIKSESGTLFCVIYIDPFSGPIYVAGPIGDKGQVNDLISEKIKWAPRSRSVAAVLELVRGTRRQSRVAVRLDSRDSDARIEQRGTALRRSSATYFNAYQKLYHALNSIRDNKFIYVFSEGISLFARQAVMQGGEEYWFFIKQTAGYLGRCGAVLFIVNPAGETPYTRHTAFGEESLRFLARESGGKYLEGTEQHIKNQIKRMSRAYYEIAFADGEAVKEGIRTIAFQANRRGVEIHTLRSLGRSKTYRRMNQSEKEVLIKELLDPSPLFHSPLQTSHLKIELSPDKKGEFLYTLELPRAFKGKSLDLYKVRTDQSTKAVKVTQDEIIPGEKPLQIPIGKKDIAELRLVLIDEQSNRALVQGVFNAQAEIEAIMADKARDFKEKVSHMEEGELAEIDRICKGVASYCDRLAKADFHCNCKEKVSEVLDEIHVHKAVRESELNVDTGSYRSAFNARDDIRAVRRKTTNKYTNDYQLVSKKGRIREERKLLKGKTKKIADEKTLFRLNNFIPKKIVHIPLMLFGPENREKFHFRFIKNERIKGVQAAVIECFPKTRVTVKTIYGRLWVDLSDYSVIRVKVNPVTLGGYSEMLKLAQYYKSKLILTCEIDFYQEHGGIRFPTRIFIREVYSGGLELRNIVKRPVWERSKTTYTFKDYKFFDLKAPTKDEDVKK